MNIYIMIIILSDAEVLEIATYLNPDDAVKAARDHAEAQFAKEHAPLSGDVLYVADNDDLTITVFRSVPE